MIEVDKTIYVGGYVPGQPGHVRPLTRMKPSRQENYHYRKYYQHLLNEAFPLRRDTGQSEVRQALVRAARMRDEPQCRPPLGLRKANGISVSLGMAQAVKSFAVSEGFSAEATGLSVLQEKLGDTIPAVLQRVDTTKTITRKYIVGPRLYDLFMLLTRIEMHESKPDLREKASAVRKCLLRKNEEWLSEYQSEEVQRALGAALAHEAEGVYQFDKKAIESIEILREYLSLDTVYWCDVRQVMNYVCSRIEKESQVFLRDANPKNVILCEPQMASSDNVGPALMSILSNARDADELGENLWARCYQIDFESVSDRSTPCDDYIHLYTSPSLSSMNDTRRWLSRLRERGWDQHVFDCTLLFRCLRSLARRIYYKHEDPSAYAARYGDEAPSHFAVLTKEAAKSTTSAMPPSLKQPMDEFVAFVDAVVGATS